MLTTSAATPSSPSERIGMPTRGPDVSPRAGRAIGTSSAISTASSRITANPQRHKPNWANKPPDVGPIRVPTPHIADTTAAARVHNFSGSAALMTAYPRPASTPPARPCTIRPTRKMTIEGASAHTAVPIAKESSAPRYDSRGPHRISTAPTVVAAITEATRYTVVTQAYSRAPPMSVTTLGNRLIVMNSLIAYSATPPARTVVAPAYSRPSKSRQLPAAAVESVTWSLRAT